MLKVFQRFDLDEGSLDRLDTEGIKRLELPQAGKTLREELLRLGYDVLESNGFYRGVPRSIIVGGDIEMDHKVDFYALIERLKLPFKTEICYIQKTNQE